MMEINQVESIIGDKADSSDEDRKRAFIIRKLELLQAILN